MYLFIVQHAPNLPPEEDPEEGLSQAGFLKAEKTAHLLKRFDLSFDTIITSTKKRAMQTAEIIAEEVGYSQQIETTDQLKARTPAEDSMRYLKRYEKVSSLLLVGHLPSILNMLSFLLSDSEVKIAYERAGVCLVEVEKLERKCGTLKWLLPTSVIEKVC